MIARVALAALMLSLVGCTDYGVDIDPTFTEAERADIYAAIDAWEHASPRWRAAVGPHVVHVRKVPALPDGWTGATSMSTHTIRLLPADDVGPLYRRLVVHELGHVAHLLHEPVDTTYPTVMRHDVSTDTDEPSQIDVYALRP